MADAEEVLVGIQRRADTIISALVPNERGLERAAAAFASGQLQEALLLHAATASVLRVNGLPDDLAKNFRRTVGLARAAKATGLRTVVFISAAFGCSIEGRVAPTLVHRIAVELYESGSVDEVVFSDSTGQADPAQVTEFFEGVLPLLNGLPFTVHFHDSRGSAISNTYALLLLQPRGLTLDCAIGGLGGDVPFLPEAAGNVCTEDLVSLLDGLRIQSGVQLTAVLEISARLKELYPGRYFPSRTLAVGPVAWKYQSAP
jgi:isopropylmalate/homocitrate/citramalate synthase